MTRKVKNSDGTLEVRLFDDIIKIESCYNRNVSIEISKVNPDEPLNPEGALYRIETYKSLSGAKGKPCEYGIAWVMTDGSIVGRDGRRC